MLADAALQNPRPRNRPRPAADGIDPVERARLQRRLDREVPGARERPQRSGVYNKAEYEAQRRRMLQEWADMVDAWARGAGRSRCCCRRRTRSVP